MKNGRNPLPWIPACTAGEEAPSLVLDVAAFLQKLPETIFPLGKRGPGDHPSEANPILFGHPIENRYGSAVSQKNPLGIHSHRIVH